MSRETHVRFSEGVGVGFPRATRLSASLRNRQRGAHSIGRYLDFYNGRRPHSSLDDSTPDQAYFNLPPLRAAA